MRKMFTLPVAAAALLLSCVLPASAAGSSLIRQEHPSAGITVSDHTLVMSAIMVNHVVIAKAFKQVKWTPACFNSTIPTPNAKCQWPEMVRMSNTMLTALLSVKTISPNVRTRASLARSQILATRNSSWQLSSADNAAVTEIYAHLRSLSTVSAMIQYLTQKQSQFRAAKRTALATGVGTGAQILKDGQSTIYSAAWLQKTLGGSRAFALLRLGPHSGVDRSHQDRNWRLIALGVAIADVGGAAGGAAVGAVAGGIGALPGGAAGALVASSGAFGGAMISAGV